jgi:hypothetical protein
MPLALESFPQTEFGEEGLGGWWQRFTHPDLVVMGAFNEDHQTSGTG